MQRLRLQSTWNKDTNSFNRDQFELRESDKSITGKVSISSKKDDKWISKALPFIAFKSKIDQKTELAIRNSGGKLFDADISIIVDSFNDESGKEIKYHKLIINKATFEGAVDKESEVVDEESDDEIPF